MNLPSPTNSDATSMKCLRCPERNDVNAMDPADTAKYDVKGLNRWAANASNTPAVKAQRRLPPSRINASYGRVGVTFITTQKRRGRLRQLSQRAKFYKLFFVLCPSTCFSCRFRQLFKVVVVPKAHPVETKMKSTAIAILTAFAVLSFGEPVQAQDCSVEAVATLTTEMWGAEIGFTISDDNGVLVSEEDFGNYSTYSCGAFFACRIRSVQHLQS